MVIMSHDAMFEVATPDVVAEDFGAEIVVLNLSNGKYFSLLGTAAALWRDIARGHVPQALLDELVGMPEAMRVALEGFVQGLLAEGLIRPAPAGTQSPAQAPESTQLLMQGAELPRLEIFDDMAELILSDPIHDVEEDRGWPALRNPA